MENPTKIDDLGTTIFGNIQLGVTNNLLTGMILQVDHLLDQNSKAMVAAVEGHAGERARFVWWPGRCFFACGFVRGIGRGSHRIHATGIFTYIWLDFYDKCR